MIATPTHLLNDGSSLPAVGLGTYPLDDDEARTAVGDGLDLGYRLIDTAVNYGNETGVGRALATSSAPAEEVRLTTKLPGRQHGYDETLASFSGSLERLGVEYVDLYLIHWPLPRVDRYVESWRAMVRLRQEGLIRSIGVSNFTPSHIDRLERETGVLPAVNQVELHPRFPQPELRAYHERKNIRTQSWSPLGRAGDLLRAPDILSVAEAHHVTPAQVVLRWHLQLGSVPIPKSASPARQRENFDIFGFELSPEEMARVVRHPHRRAGGDPDQHEEL